MKDEDFIITVEETDLYDANHIAITISKFNKELDQYIDENFLLTKEEFYEALTQYVFK